MYLWSDIKTYFTNKRMWFKWLMIIVIIINTDDNPNEFWFFSSICSQNIILKNYY